MKKFKKILALGLSLAMVLGMGVTSFAVELGNTTPTSSDEQKADVVISNMSINEAEFRAVQIIEPEYVDNKFTGSYKWTAAATGKSGSVIPTAGSSLSSVAGLTSEKVQEWAAGATELVTATAGTGDTVKVNLGVGTWIIVATPKTDVNVVYNPMIASVYYTKTDGNDKWTVTPGNLDAAGQWGLETENAYTKSTDLSTETDKKIGKLNADGTFTEGQVNGEIGTTNDYQLKGIIPSYGADYFKEVEVSGSKVQRTVFYILQDSQNGRLEYQNDLVVKVGGSVLQSTTTDNTQASPVTKTNYTVTWYSEENCGGTVYNAYNAAAKSFKIAFDSSYIEGLASAADTERKVEVTYSAKIKAGAVEQVAENTYKLFYTRTPGETEDQVTNRTPIEKKEYTYSASINGTVKKVDSANQSVALSGATFGLYADAAGTTEITSALTQATDANGMVKFNGLQFGKTYYLKETTAPAGYSLSDKVYSVVCSYTDDNKDNDGKLTSYTVTIKDESDPTAVAKVINNVSYGGSATVLDAAFPILNTTLASLPSTGGIGTTIFTIGGCAIMILAAALYFATRRKSAK